MAVIEKNARAVACALKESPTSTDAYISDALKTPVVYARWRLKLPEHLYHGDEKHVVIRVAGWNMKGCQIVHKGQRISQPQPETALHAECVQVVQNWEDIDVAECAASKH